MQPITFGPDFFTNLKKEKPRKEEDTYTIGDFHGMSRKQLINYAKWRLNTLRKGTKFKSLSWTAVSNKVSHLDDWDLNLHIATCEKSSNFSQCFFGKLKVK